MFETDSTLKPEWPIISWQLSWHFPRITAIKEGSMSRYLDCQDSYSTTKGLYFINKLSFENIEHFLHSSNFAVNGRELEDDRLNIQSMELHILPFVLL